jgi:hypothetical protein
MVSGGLTIKTKRKSDDLVEVMAAPEVAAKIEFISKAEATPAGWLTLEHLLYGLIVAVGLALRAWNLAGYPLSGAEAAQAEVALTLARGGLPEPGAYSPLLASLNALTFFLFGATDASARLASLLLGGLLILLPLTLRRLWGPTVCLLAAGLLALSPSAIFLSRTLNAEIGVAVGALAVVTSLFNGLTVNGLTANGLTANGLTANGLAANGLAAGRQRWLLVAAGGLAVLLTAGPMAYSILLLFALLALLGWAVFFNGSTAKALLWAKSLSHPPGQSRDGTGPALTVPHTLRHAGLFFVVTLAILSTAATFNPSGLGVLTILFEDGVGRFGLQTRPEAGFNAVFLLTIYEPLLVVAGLVGLALAILRRNVLELIFGGWFVGSLVLDLLLGGRPNGNLILSLVPLAFLAAFALARLGESLWQWGTWSNEGLLVAAGLVMAVVGYIFFTMWLEQTCSPEDWRCVYGWMQPVIVSLLFVTVAAVFAFVGGPGAVVRGTALVGVILGLLLTINISWRLNYGPLMHLAYQPLAGVPASTGLRTLAETLTEQSAEQVGDATLLDVTIVEISSPALRWQLRDYRNLKFAPSIFEAPASRALITPVTEDKKLGVGEAYIGQDFELDALWSPAGLPPKDLVKWLVYRRATGRPGGNKVVVWFLLESNNK